LSEKHSHVFIIVIFIYSFFSNALIDINADSQL
jgi:hypothetical protein